MSIETNSTVICLVDHGDGYSISNGAALLIKELFLWLDCDLNSYRVIYCDTMKIWDGLAHRDGAFVGYVPLRQTRREDAIALAISGQDKNGNPWP